FAGERATTAAAIGRIIGRAAGGKPVDAEAVVGEVPLGLTGHQEHDSRNGLVVVGDGVVRAFPALRDELTPRNEHFAAHFGDGGAPAIVPVRGAVGTLDLNAQGGGDALVEVDRDTAAAHGDAGGALARGVGRV